MARFKCLTNMNAPAMEVLEPYDIEHMRQHRDYIEVDESDTQIGPDRKEQREPWMMPVGKPTGGPTQPLAKPARPRK